MALVLGFVLNLKGEGLWSGLIVGSMVQCVLLTLVTSFTSWEKQVIDSTHKVLSILEVY